MSVQLIQTQDKIAILIAPYSLNMQEIIEAIQHKEKTGKSPQCISVLLYDLTERELAHNEYELLSCPTEKLDKLAKQGKFSPTSRPSCGISFNSASPFDN